MIDKILSLKEEGGSSSFNQVYDQEVAKSDNEVLRMSLSYLHQDVNSIVQSYSHAIFDQCELICAVVLLLSDTHKNTPRSERVRSEQ